MSLCPNWSDAELHFLITTWKDRHPICKRQNSAVWESIAKEPNSLLREQGRTSIRTAAQCKAKIKNLEDEYKRVKDHNSQSGNDRESFAQYEQLNEILGCRAKITPKTFVECGFIDDNSAIPGPSLEELSESGDNEIIRDGVEQKHLLGVNLLPKRAKSASLQCPIHPNKKAQNLPNLLNPRMKTSHFHSQFFSRINVEVMETRLVRRLLQQPSLQLKKKKDRKTESSGNAEYFAFLNESQKRDHEFCEKLAEKEAEREMKSQQMMFSMAERGSKDL